MTVWERAKRAVSEEGDGAHWLVSPLTSWQGPEGGWEAFWGESE